MYATTDGEGAPALASAVVAYPTAAPTDGERPVLAWQHGTTGVARSCAPSVGADALTELAIPGISRAIERGWAVVATDYPGQGTHGAYPYLVGEGEGRATLDGIRALRAIDDAHASEHAWIWGHSQGGHATLWAGQLAADYAPELDVLGVAALSAASDPLALASRITTGDPSPLASLVTSLVLVPYAEAYPDVELDATVHPAGHGIVEAFASRCVIEAPTLVSVLVGASLSWDAPLYRIDVSEGPTHDRLAQNRADGIVPAPLFLGQGTDDEVIPIELQRTLAAELCAADRTVEVHEYEGRSHMGVIAEGSPLIDDLFAWADAVTLGQAPANC
nr:lipase family protein [Pseudoclavibacter chungangensis]